MHIVMGCILGLLALTLCAIAIEVGPKLWTLKPGIGTRFGFTLMMVSLSCYIFWVAALFYADKLGPENYTPALWTVRICALVGALLFLFGVRRCNIFEVVKEAIED